MVGILAYSLSTTKIRTSHVVPAINGLSHSIQMTKSMKVLTYEFGAMTPTRSPGLIPNLISAYARF